MLNYDPSSAGGRQDPRIRFVVVSVTAGCTEEDPRFDRDSHLLV